MSLLKLVYVRYKKAYYKKIISVWVIFHSQIDKTYDEHVIVRYEQFKADLVQAIHDFSERLQNNIDEKIIQVTVDFFSFEKAKLGEQGRKVTFFSKSTSRSWNSSDSKEDLHVYFLRQMDNDPRSVN